MGNPQAPDITSLVPSTQAAHVAIAENIREADHIDQLEQQHVDNVCVQQVIGLLHAEDDLHVITVNMDHARVVDYYSLTAHVVIPYNNAEDNQQLPAAALHDDKPAMPSDYSTWPKIPARKRLYELAFACFTISFTLMLSKGVPRSSSLLWFISTIASFLQVMLQLLIIDGNVSNIHPHTSIAHARRAFLCHVLCILPIAIAVVALFVATCIALF